MTALCLHCHKPCRLTNGAEIYPHRSDLADKPIWKCDACDARVGCHPGGIEPLGYAADAPTRDARSKLHDLRLDPLWMKKAKRPAGVKRLSRREVYKFLSDRMGREFHVGESTIEECREAWQHLGELWKVK